MAFQETPAGDIVMLGCTHIRVDLRLAKIPPALKPSHASVPPPPMPARLLRSAAAAVWPPVAFGRRQEEVPFPNAGKGYGNKKVLRPVPISICQNYTPHCFKCALWAIWQPTNSQKAQKKKRLAVRMQPIRPTSSSSVGFEIVASQIITNNISKPLTPITVHQRHSGSSACSSYFALSCCVCLPVCAVLFSTFFLHPF